MKTHTQTLLKTGLILLLFTGLLFTGCDNSDYDSVSREQDDELVAKELTQIDEVSEGVNAIIENVYASFESRNERFKGVDDKLVDYLPECVTITKVITATTRTVDVDFGDGGCAMPNGDVLKGIIHIEFTLNIAKQSVEIAYSFEDFYYNGLKIEGTVNKVRMRMNENGNPETIHTKNIKITWEDGSFAEVNGERKREWISGFGNKNWADNVFSITGEWTIKRRNGKVYEAKIVEPLIRKLACRFIVSGTVSIQRNGNSMLLDYGDGTCDDLATVTINGEVKEIHLGKWKDRD